ncbi:UDP-glucose:protein N-beta-glucosyltransferase [Phycisphaerales bacterium]|nr:UDP-glucose:protein N-beta-glucosyltransferase [Phycisphaerales bacterium]
MTPRNPAVDQRLKQVRGHIEHKRFSQAHAALLALVRQRPADSEVNRLLAEVCEELGQPAQSFFYAQRAYDTAPGDPGAALRLARSMAAVEGVPRAIEFLGGAVRAHPGQRDLRGELIMMLLNSDRVVEAGRVCEEGLAQDPEADSIRAAYAMVLRKAGRLAEARAILRELQWRRPGDVFPVEYLSVLLLYDPDASGETIFSLHQQFGKLVDSYSADLGLSHPSTDDPDRLLRVGLLSPDFYTHSVSYFAEPILDGLDRAAFEVTCYHTGVRVDELSQRLRAKAARFRHLPMIDSPTLARRIHADRIDILIDLTGLYSGHRLHAMSIRPAPVQMTYIGYPATTGIPNIDYRIVDSLTDPPGAERLATERLLRLDPCFLCYRPPDRAPDVRVAAREPGVPITFGSFNSALKVNRRVIRVWGEIMNRVPGSRILLKGLGLRQVEVRDEFAARFAAEGVEASRIELVPQTEHWLEHLEMYGRVDVALDTFPYNGTTTTCEALFMGVPVVALEGTMHAGRVGLSLLSAVGLRELAAADEAGYVRMATALAEDVERRRELRTTLRERLLRSAVCDGAGFGARLGVLLRDAWRARCAGPTR